MSETKRIHMTVPEGFESLFEWFVSVAPEFRGWSEASIAAHFFKLGLQAAYEEGLKNAEPLNSDDFGPVADSQLSAFEAALEK